VTPELERVVNGAGWEAVTLVLILRTETEDWANRCLGLWIGNQKSAAGQRITLIGKKEDAGSNPDKGT